MKKAIGIDIGGTITKIGVVSEDGICSLIKHHFGQKNIQNSKII